MSGDDEDQVATTGPAKGDFIAPLDIEERDERADALPAQEEFWRPPTRFGSVPVEKEPLGRGSRLESFVRREVSNLRQHIPRSQREFRLRRAAP